MDNIRKKTPTLTPIVLVVVVAVFIVLLFLAFFATNKRETISQDQTTSQWAAVQANHEAQRFMIAAERFFSGDPQVDRDALIIRYEILLSRLPLFYSGREAKGLLLIDGLRPQIQSIERDIIALEPIVVEGQRGDRQALDTIRSSLDETAKRLSDLVFEAIQTLPQTHRVTYWHNFLLILYACIAVAGVGLATLVALIYVQTNQAEKVTDQYRKALLDADTANRSKSRLLANVSHELRTPLNAIIGFSDVLKDQLFGNLGNERYLEYSKYINESGAHLLNLVNDLLNYAKHEAKELTLTMEALPLNELIVDALRMTSPEAGRMGVKLVLAEGMNVNVLADQRAVRQIITNLIGNAAKYSPQNAAVEIRCLPEKQNRVRVEVLDRGPGIPDTEVDRLLRPFERLHRDSFVANDESGAGLGLALAQALAQKHGGGIKLARREGGGTVASFTLAISIDDETADGIDNNAEDTASKGTSSDLERNAG